MAEINGVFPLVGLITVDQPHLLFLWYLESTLVAS